MAGENAKRDMPCLSAFTRRVQTNLHLELSTCHSGSGASDELVSGKLGSAAVRA